MPDTDPYTDVVELCALLQCLGFTVKSLDANNTNVSQDGSSGKTVVINCQSSGLHVVLESTGAACSCPQNQESSGIWHVSGMAGGKQLDKEFGYSILGTLPKSHRDRLSRELHEIIKCIKQNNETELKNKDVSDRSNSMVDLKTPEKIHHKIKLETPTRYRSLDTLINVVKAENNVNLPPPKSLQRIPLNSECTTDDDNDDKKQSMCLRQGTYTLCSTPDVKRTRSKTSSPIHATQKNMVNELIIAEQSAVALGLHLNSIIKEYTGHHKNDSTTSWQALDVSKISVLKGSESLQPQFVSSPNLRGPTTREDSTKLKLNRHESASTSNLAPNKPNTHSKATKTSYLRRISPNFLKLKKSSQGVKEPKSIPQENSSSGGRTIGLIKPKVVVQASQSYSRSTPNLSTSSRNKFSHVKSTIPKPTKKIPKDEI